MRKMSKKGSFGITDLPKVALAFLLVGVFFAIALVILAAVKGNSTVQANAAANTAIDNTITAVSEIPNNWLLILAVVVAAAVVIGVVLSNLGGAMGGGTR